MALEYTPSIVITNLHRRYTGVSSTVDSLFPRHSQNHAIGLLDTGGLAHSNKVTLGRILLDCWRKPSDAQPGTQYRVWHARRDIEMLLGIFLRSVLRQPWKLVFTSAAPKRHGLALRIIINQMDAIIASSQRAASFLDWHSCVINHGIDTELYSLAPIDHDKTTPRSTSIPTDGESLIGVFGRVRKSKGTDVFVQAMLKLLPLYPNWNAVVVGLCRPSDMAFQQQLVEAITAAGLENRIKFLGHLSNNEVRAWYQRISICAAPSRREGYGLTPFEAMACGCVAVTSDTGVWPQLHGHDFVRVVKSGNVEATADAIEHFIRQEEKIPQLGNQAREFVVNEFSIDREAYEIDRVYTDLLSGRVPPRLYNR